jgi:hypothetical protein
MVLAEFALVLEQFETAFYTQALATFQPSDFTNAGFTSAQIPAQLFTGIQADETAHTNFITVCDQRFCLSCRLLIFFVAIIVRAPVARPSSHLRMLVRFLRDPV